MDVVVPARARHLAGRPGIRHQAHQIPGVRHAQINQDAEAHEPERCLDPPIPRQGRAADQPHDGRGCQRPDIPHASVEQQVRRAGRMMAGIQLPHGPLPVIAGVEQQHHQGDGENLDDKNALSLAQRGLRRRMRLKGSNGGMTRAMAFGCRGHGRSGVIRVRPAAPSPASRYPGLSAATG